jgi:hypothetical protein
MRGVQSSSPSISTTLANGGSAIPIELAEVPRRLDSLGSALYLAPTMSLRPRVLPAGFVAPCLPTTAPHPPSGFRSAVFARFVQVDHRHCQPAANETMLGLRRAVGTEVVHWLGANKPAYKLDPLD